MIGRVDAHRPPEELRVLGSFEVQLRNLAAIQPRAQAAVERLQAQQPELATVLRARMVTCELQGLIDATSLLRTRVERDGR